MEGCRCSKTKHTIAPGRRVSGEDADAAIRAMDLLAKHLMDRLAQKGSIYPRATYALVGPDGLHQRERLAPVLSALEKASDNLDDWIARYVVFVKGLLAEGDS